MQDDTAEPTEAVTDPKENPTRAVADAKEKMRAALDRKRAVEHRTAEGRKNTGSVHGSETGTAATKRMFRRKSG